MTSKSIEKIIEDIAALTVLELADLGKAFEEKFGVSAMAMVAPAAPAAAAGGAEAAKSEEKSEYKVELVESGPEKIKAIKALRTVKKDLGLTDAKNIVESAPTVIDEAMAKADALALKEALEAAGAKVKLS